MIFYSKRDRWIVVMVVLLIVASIFGVVVSLFAVHVLLWPRVLVAILLSICIYFSFKSLNNRYIIHERELHIVFLYKEKITIDSITRIRATNDSISSPAMSTDRIELFFGKKNKSVLLSPKDKNGFIDALVAKNSHIELDVNLAYMKRGKDDGIPSKT